MTLAAPNIFFLSLDVVLQTINKGALALCLTKKGLLVLGSGFKERNHLSYPSVNQQSLLQGSWLTSTARFPTSHTFDIMFALIKKTTELGTDFASTDFSR